MSEAQKTWYALGNEAISKWKDASEAQQNVSKSRNFWIPLGQTKTVTFLDDLEFYYMEHSVKKDGKWSRYVCISEREPCPLCMADVAWVSKKSPKLATTVIDHSSWTDKNGKEHKYMKRLASFSGKDAIARLLRLRDENAGSLNGLTVKCERGSKTQSPACGEVFYLARPDRVSKEQVMKIAPDGSEADYAEAYNYAEILKPLSAEELRAVVGLSTPIGGTPEEDPFGTDEPKDTAPVAGNAEDLI